jgi:signal peptidase II
MAAHDQSSEAMKNPATSGRSAVRRFRLIFLTIALLFTVSCDQTSKHLARTRLSQGDAVQLPGGLGELRLAGNPGAFLSLGSLLPQSTRTILFTVIVGLGLAGLCAWLTRNARLSRISFAGLALIFAGGTSNLIDRISQHGLVTDFVVIRIGPLHTGVFNIADVIVMIGLVALAFSLRSSRKVSRDTNSRTPRR